MHIYCVYTDELYYCKEQSHGVHGMETHAWEIMDILL